MSGSGLWSRGKRLEPRQNTATRLSDQDSGQWVVRGKTKTTGIEGNRGVVYTASRGWRGKELKESDVEVVLEGTNRAIQRKRIYSNGDPVTAL
jgi:hypothetical protein